MDEKIFTTVKQLANKYSAALEKQLALREQEMAREDATTDGGHITKEHILQETLKTLYNGIGGEYFYGDDAWRYLCELTGIDLLGILRKIADSRGVV